MCNLCSSQVMVSTSLYVLMLHITALKKFRALSLQVPPSPRFQRVLCGISCMGFLESLFFEYGVNGYHLSTLTTYTAPDWGSWLVTSALCWRACFNGLEPHFWYLLLPSPIEHVDIQGSQFFRLVGGGQLHRNWRPACPCRELLAAMPVLQSLSGPLVLGTC